MDIQVQDHERDSLAVLAKCIQALRRIAPELPVQAAHVFLTIAITPGIATPQLMGRVRLAQSSCSRNVAMLSERHRKGTPGLGLVAAYPDPSDSRRKVMYLTASGRKLAKELVNILNRHSGSHNAIQTQLIELGRQCEAITREVHVLQEMMESATVTPA